MTEKNDKNTLNNTAEKLFEPLGKLTLQQARFVDAYLETLDPVLSARRAGYSKSGLVMRAHALLSNPKILAELNSRLTQHAKTLKVTKGFIVKNLLAIIENTAAIEPVLDKSGAPTGQTKLKDASVALRALESLAKHSLAADSIQETAASASPQIICVENLDDNKI